MDELIYSSATELARVIQAKEASSVEVVKAYLERIDAANPKLNAIVQLTAETALEQARESDAALARGEIKGPLHGVPITIKDSLDTAGVITTGGTKGRSSYVPKQDATVVTRLRSAGAILLGKTNIPEICLAPETNNLVYGCTNNPYDLSRTPGGSSGGEAAIIAAGGSPLGIGTDILGSIRFPCHCCGLAGIKPTSGRVPRTGDILAFSVGALDSWAQVGPLARYVEDLALTLPIIAGVDWRDAAIVPMPLGDPQIIDIKSLRCAVYTDNGLMSVSLETASAVTAGAKALAEAGASVQEDCPKGVERTYEIYKNIMDGDGRTWTRRLLEKAGTTTAEMTPALKRFLDQAQSIPAGEFTIWLEQMDMVRSDMISFMASYDVILCPVNPFPAQPHGKTVDTVENFRKGLSHTYAYNLVGWPGAVVRVGTSPEGLPIGVQIVAQPWREDLALAVAQHLETIFGGWQRPSLET
jgi:amidase